MGNRPRQGEAIKKSWRQQTPLSGQLGGRLSLSARDKDFFTTWSRETGNKQSRHQHCSSFFFSSKSYLFNWGSSTDPASSHPGGRIWKHILGERLLFLKSLFQSSWVWHRGGFSRFSGFFLKEISVSLLWVFQSRWGWEVSFRKRPSENSRCQNGNECGKDVQHQHS